MRLSRKWVFSLGLLASMPGATWAGPLDGFRRTESSATAQPASQNQQVAENIANTLRTANLSGRNIQIEFENGVATISGEILNAEQHATVSRLTSSVAGVRTVNNLLRVSQGGATAPQSGVTQAAYGGANPEQARQATQVSHQSAAPGRTNQQVAQEIARALVQAGLGSANIEVRFLDGAASLIGDVRREEEAHRAEHVARQVAGVQHVVNRLTVEGRPVQSPSQGQVIPASGMPYGPAWQTAAYPYQPDAYHPAMQAPMPHQMGPSPMMAPGSYGHAQPASHMMYNQPHLPQNAWPSYAPYDNYAAVTYPKMYDASAWPYIGPYYPYPQVPLEWRQATLEWDDGYWSLKFRSRTDKWWWFLHPKNWD